VPVFVKIFLPLICR